MNRIKTFEQYNIQYGNKVNEEFLDNTKSKLDTFLQDPTDKEMADKLLQKLFTVTFNQKSTKAYKELVKKLSLEDKVKLLKDASKKLEYSPLTSLRLIKSKLSDKFQVGSITRNEEKPVQY